MKSTGIIGLVIGIIAVIGISIAVGASRARPTSTYAGPNNPVGAASAETPTTKADLGTMTNRDIKNAKFSIKNSGSGPLELTSVSTSCDCTYAYLTIGTQKSPKFTMHGTTNWKGSVPAGQEAQLEIIYEPAIMPVKGPVTRMVSVTTNDPKNPTLMFEVSATVTQ